MSSVSKDQCWWWWWWSLFIIWMMSAVSTWLLLIQTGSGGISQRHSMSFPSDQGERTSPRLSVRAPKLHVSSTKELGLDHVIYFKIATILYFFIESYYLFSFIFSTKQSNWNLVIILSLRNFLSHIIYNNHLRRRYYISIIFVK